MQANEERVRLMRGNVGFVANRIANRKDRKAFALRAPEILLFRIRSNQGQLVRIGRFLATVGNRSLLSNADANKVRSTGGANRLLNCSGAPRCP
jgi:hypothetical protein